MVLRGGLLAGAATAALGIGTGFVDPGICSIDDGNDDSGGGGGGLLDDLLDDAPVVVDDKAADDKDPPVVDDKAVDDKDPPAVADWMKQFSGEAPEAGEPSNQEWLAKLGVKDLDSVVKIARDNQKALRESGRIKVPGADAKPEEIKAFHAAIGVPDKPEGYEIKLPETTAGKFELDTAFLDPMRAVALEHGVPKAAFEALAAKFVENQVEGLSADAATNNAAKEAKVKAWGAEAPQRKEEFRRGASILQLDKSAINRMQAGLGVGETMDLIARVGHMAGEDFFAGGEASQRFGVASAEDAQKAIDAMVNDPATAKKLRDKSDKALTAKYNRLCDAKAHFDEIAKKR